MASDSTSVIDFVGIIGDVRDLVTAFKAGDFFGDSGILAVLQRLLGRIKTTGLADPVKMASVSCSPKECDELRKCCEELEAVASKVGASTTDMKGLPPEITSALIGFAKQLVNAFFLWLSNRITPTPPPSA